MPEQWRPFLGELDAALDVTTRLDCVGGFVLTMVYGMDRPTADVDVLEIAPPVLQESSPGWLPKVPTLFQS